MDMRLLVSLFVLSLAVCGAVKVTKIALVGKDYATVQGGQAQVRCTYTLEAGEGGAWISFTKNGQVIHTASGPPRVNPNLEYTATTSVDTSQRRYWGEVKCAVKTKSGDTSSRGLTLFIADTPSYPWSRKRYALDTMAMKDCVALFNYASVPSDPPLETTCGIWLFDSPDPRGAHSQEGMWLDGEYMRGSYSSEEGDFVRVRAGYKHSSYKLTGVNYTLTQLPTDKRMEHRCERSYVFDAGAYAVRIPVDVSSIRIQRPFNQRCVILQNRHFFNMTVEPESEPHCTTAAITEKISISDTLKAKLSCEHGSSSELMVECFYGAWRAVAAAGEAPGEEYGVSAFTENCWKLGNGAVAPLASLTLLVASAGILLAN